MSRKRPARSGNPDLRRAMQVPGPPIEEIEAKLLYWLTPESFKPLRLTPGSQKLRDGVPPRKLRLLTYSLILPTDESGGFLIKTTKGLSKALTKHLY